MKKHLITLAITVPLFAIAIMVGIVIARTTEKADAAGNLSNQSCVASSTSIVTVGNQLDSLILATSSARAWARIQMPNNASSTIYLGFKNDAAATAISGLPIAEISGASTSTPYIDFGLNTDFPYTGAVHGLTAFGSTTVFVTQCLYQ